jgi:preprotein translocase subunit SecA
VTRSKAAKWQMIARETGKLVARGVPVLIGTRSVASSLEMSRALDAAGIAHVVLNAAQDAAEAEIVAAAGTPGRVTVATNLAGRGTDIGLAPGVAERGGLHVIMSERHEASRIDRQLMGRCARQGDPGEYRAILSREDPVLADSNLWVTRLACRLLMPIYGSRIGARALRRAQRKAESLHARMRRDLLRNDETIDHVLAFSGTSE